MSARVMNCVNHALMVLPLPSDGPGKRAWSSLLEAQKLLKSLSTEPGEAEGYTLNREQIVPVWAAMLAMVDDVHSGQDNLNDKQWQIAEQVCRDLTAMLDAAAPLPEESHHGR